MDGTKMIDEDVVEEHNGVYGGKWQKVSPEGFDLPEGLNYLKNSWVVNWNDYNLHEKKRIHRYVAKIKVSKVALAESSQKLHQVLKKFRAYETDLEIENCGGDTRKSK